MMKLGSADKKIWTRICAMPMWEEQLKPSLQERLLDRHATAVLHRESGTYVAMRPMFPHLQDEQLRDMTFDLGVFLDQQDTRTGIARRVWLDDPAELAQFLSYAARAHWLREGHALGIDSIPSTCVELAIAVCDWTFVEHVLASCRFPLRQGDSWQQISPFSPEAPARSDALLGYLLGRYEDAEKALRWLDTQRTSEQDKHDRACLWGLLQNDSQRFLEGLESLRDGTRKIRGTIDHEYRLVSIGLHCYYELAFHRNPALVVGWDIDQPLPWDAGLYRWCRSGVPAITAQHLMGLSPEIVSRILNLPRPNWWDGLPRRAF